MTDCNTNKMDAQAQVEPDPDDSGTLPSATPPSGPLPMGAEALARLPDSADASAFANCQTSAGCCRARSPGGGFERPGHPES